jgi:hypothetical protein
MEQEAGPSLLTINTNTISFQSLSNPLNIESFEEIESIPKVADLWLPIVEVSPSHMITLFLPKIDGIFAIGDKMVRLEHSGVESKILMCRLGRNAKGGWLWNFEHHEKMQYE